MEIGGSIEVAQAIFRCADLCCIVIVLESSRLSKKEPQFVGRLPNRVPSNLTGLTSDIKVKGTGPTSLPLEKIPQKRSFTSEGLCQKEKVKKLKRILLCFRFDNNLQNYVK